MVEARKIEAVLAILSDFSGSLVSGLLAARYLETGSRLLFRMPEMVYH